MASLVVRQLSRRSLLRGSASGIGAALLGGGRLRGTTAAGTTVTWMSNQLHDQEVKAELFAQFEANSGIRVEMRIFPDDYGDQLKLAFAAGDPPDIYRMNVPSQEIEAGWPEPLDAYLAATPGLKESFLPGSFIPNRGIWNGQAHGLPMYAPTMRLYYNRTIFQRAGLDPDRPPATFGDFRAYAKQITDALKGDDVYGLILGDKYTWVWWMNGECPGNTAGTYTFDWRTGRYNHTGEGLKEALRLLIAMEEDGSIFPGIHALTDDDARQQFGLGRAGMVVGGSWNVGVFNDALETKEDWAVAELPRPDGGARGRVQQSLGDRYTIAASSKQKDAAWEVLKFIYSRESMTALYERGMGVMAVAAANTGRSTVRGVAGVAPTPGDLVIPPEPELTTFEGDPYTLMQQIWDERGRSMDERLADYENAANAAFDAQITAGDAKREDFTIPDFDPLTWNPANG
ncbi:MAG TPA: sugar ABC transporter substrate-binding protein [Thermomicrobiales bacterium]|nr:sugar ABC transporter substrate-binding protein [Thermomicrobiales bacterium]